MNGKANTNGGQTPDIEVMWHVCMRWLLCGLVDALICVFVH